MKKKKILEVVKERMELAKKPKYCLMLTKTFESLGEELGNEEVEGKQYIKPDPLLKHYGMSTEHYQTKREIVERLKELVANGDSVIHLLEED